MTKTSLRIKLPKDIMALPEDDRDDVVDAIAYALTLPKTIDTQREGGSEADMWAPNDDPLLGSAEDALYSLLSEAGMEMLSEVFTSLELPTDSLTKSFEDDLLKAKSKKPSLKELIEVNKAKRDKFLTYLQDMNPFSKAQLKKLDTLLKTKLPDYAKMAEDFMIRAGFIAKARSEADSLHMELTGAIIDRFPQTIQAAQKEDVVLTLKELERVDVPQVEMKPKTRPVSLRIAELTPQESRAIEIASHHAATKMTEISVRHMEGVKQLVLRAQKERWEPSKLASELFDLYGDHNRDWRRVAITELAFAANDAFLAGCAEGDRVVGMGAVDACKHCKSLVIGKEFIVLSRPPERETYETDTKYLWVGKSNYGRKTSEYVACVPTHPMCRCRMHKVSIFYEVKPDGKLHLKTTAQLIQEERARRGLAPDPTLQ